jgi:hypothetical protein
MNQNKVKIAVVYWTDACHIARLVDIEDARKEMPLNCIDVGFLLENSKSKVVLASTIDEDEQANHINVIPKKYVQKIRILNVLETN